MKALEKIAKIFKNNIFAITFLYDVCLCLNIHLWRVFVLEIPRNLTWGNSFRKVTGNKALISMKQDSTREKIVSTLKYGNLFNVDMKISVFQTSWYKNKIGF